MIRYRLHFEEGMTVEVCLPIHEPQQVAELRYTGEPILIDEARFYLETASGLRGHTIGQRTSAGDLDYAMRRAPEVRKYRPELLSGQALIDAYELPHVDEGKED